MQKKISYPDNVQSRVDLVRIKSYPLHFHKQDLQVIYILKGEIRLTLTNAHYYLGQGDVHIVHPDDIHDIQSLTEDNLLLMVSIHAPYYEKFIPNLRNLIFTANVRDESNGQVVLQQLIDAILSLTAEQYRRDSGMPDSMQEKTIRLLTVLTTHFRGFSINPRRDLEHKTTYDMMQINRISNVICYIYENYASKLSLSEIAEHEHISLHYLSHLFQRYVGISFRDFIGYARVEMSLHELLTTDHSISRISQNCGFSNAQYYTRNFHAWFGILPKDFRQKNAHLTLAYVDPDYEPCSLKDMKHAIPGNVFSQLFEDKSDQYQMIHLDWSEVVAENRDMLPSVQVDFDPVSLQGNSYLTESFPEETIASLYRDAAEQRDLIAFLKAVTEHKVIPPGSHPYIDRIENPHGFQTANGLRKPLLHLFHLLGGSSAYITAYGSCYFLLRNDRSRYLVVFNEHRSGILQTDVLLHAAGRTIQVTKHVLHVDNTCIKYWGQLQFCWDIREGDRRRINQITKPEVTFQILPDAEPQQYSCSLNPLDVAVIEFSLCKR